MTTVVLDDDWGLIRPDAEPIPEDPEPQRGWLWMGLFKLDPFGACCAIGGERLSEIVEPRIPRQRVAIPYDGAELTFQGPLFRHSTEDLVRVEGVGVWDRQEGGTCLHVSPTNPMVLRSGDTLQPNLVLRDTGHPVFSIRNTLRHMGLL